MDTLASLETKIIHSTRSTTARLNLFTVAHPKAVSLAEDQVRGQEDLLAELRSTRLALTATHQALEHALGQLCAANAHCTAIHRELGSVREKLINVRKTRECGSKKIKAHFVTSKGLRLEFNQEEAERQERNQAAAEKDKKKEAEDAVHAQQIANDALNRDFTGRMAAYKKDDLRALAIAIGVSDKGTNAELIARIEGHFEQHPDLKHNSRFQGLFNKSIRAAPSQRRGPVPVVAAAQSVPSHNEQQQRQQEDERVFNHFSYSHPQHPPSAVATSSSHHHFHHYGQYIPSNIIPDVNADAVLPPDVHSSITRNFGSFQPYFNYSTPQ